MGCCIWVDFEMYIYFLIVGNIILHTIDCSGAVVAWNVPKTYVGTALFV